MNQIPNGNMSLPDESAVNYHSSAAPSPLFRA